MTPQEQELIEKLAQKLASNTGGNKDAGAESLIASRIANQPDIVYKLTQVALAQEVALKELKERNDYLQRNAEFYREESQRGGLSKMFGGDRRPPPPPQPAYRPSAFGGFMQTAAGVAAGMVAGSALSHLFFGNEFGGSEVVEDVTNNTIIEDPSAMQGDQGFDPSQDPSQNMADDNGSFLQGTDGYTQDYTGGGWNQNTGFDDGNTGFNDDNSSFANVDPDDDPNQYGGGDDGFFGGDDSGDWGGGFDDDNNF